MHCRQQLSSTPLHWICAGRILFAKTQEAISSMLYEHWDNAAEISGPRQRPRESATAQPLGFKLLAVNSNGKVVWPDSILGAFHEGTAEYKELEKKKAKFLEMCPSSAPASAGQRDSVSTSNPRSSATPDFSIEDGAMPIDPSRVVDLAGISTQDFTAERPGF